MSAIIEGEPLDAMIIKCRCPSGEKHMADMVIMRTAHEGHFDHMDIHCDRCMMVWNTTLMFMEAWEQ
ncbi:MAG: hypothetical protein HOC79_05630 [Euryarchaeota archaeon]|jgi:hypothetical protein|nr:hypothetical protein [Euryarchaeota archaeon]